MVLDTQASAQPSKQVLSPPKQCLTTGTVLSPPKRFSPNEGITHCELPGAGMAAPHPPEHPQAQGQVWAPRRGIAPRASPALGRQGGEGTGTPGSPLPGLHCSPQRGPLQFPPSTHTGCIVLQKGRTAQGLGGGLPIGVSPVSFALVSAFPPSITKGTRDHHGRDRGDQRQGVCPGGDPNVLPPPPSTSQGSITAGETEIARIPPGAPPATGSQSHEGRGPTQIPGALLPEYSALGPS